MMGELLYSKGMIKFGRFRLTSGKESSVYVDLRPLPSFPDAFSEVVEMLSERVSEDYLCGIAVGGLPLATAVAFKLKIPLVYVRKERKEHGTMSRMEGVLKGNPKVLVLDDVATTGGSLLRAIEEVRSRGGVVERALVVVDRKQGAKEALAKVGVKLESLSTLPSLVEELMPSLPPDERAHALSYLEEVRG